MVSERPSHRKRRACQFEEVKPLAISVAILLLLVAVLVPTMFIGFVLMDAYIVTDRRVVMKGPKRKG